MRKTYRWISSYTYGVLTRFIKALAVVIFAATALHAEEMKIVALGDSLTQGYGLPQDDGFVPQLERWLRDQGADVALVNAGVSGDTTAGGLSRVEWSLTDDTDALIVTLGGNDLLRAIAPEVSRQNLSDILAIADARDLPVLLIGMPAPLNYGADYKDAFDKIYPELAEEYETLYIPSFFIGLTRDGASAADLQSYLQSDGLHPNVEGVAKIVEGIGPAVLTLIDQIE